MEDWQSGAEILKNLGLRFKDYRLRLNMTQKEVSEKTAISIPTIYKFENGRLNDMATSNLIKLVRIVGLQSTGTNFCLICRNPRIFIKKRKKQRVRHLKVKS